MIGLVDLDFQTSTSLKLIPPNLEIMKLASYYKLEKNLFCRLINLDETELTGYEKIYIFSEQIDHAPVPPAFLKAPQVVYGGTGFTNKIYKPFENELIDYTLPRTFIYKELLKEKYNEGVQTKVIEHILDDSYYRNYAGTNELPLVSVKPNKRFYLYDRDFFYPDWQETIEKISARKPSTIIRIHPIECTNLTNFFLLRQYSKLNRTNSIILNLDIDLKDMHYLLKNYKNKLLAEITPSSNIFIPLGGNYKSAIHYYKDLIYKLNLLYSFWSCGIPLKFYYEISSIGFHNPISNLDQFVTQWSKQLQNQKRDLNEKLNGHAKTAKISLEEKNIITKLYPYAADLFTQTFNNIYKRGVWRV